MRNFGGDQTFLAFNRRNNSVAILSGFGYWEQVQSAFRVGITMPDGAPATGIGRSNVLPGGIEHVAKRQGVLFLKYSQGKGEA